MAVELPPALPRLTVASHRDGHRQLGPQQVIGVAAGCTSKPLASVDCLLIGRSERGMLLASSCCLTAPFPRGSLNDSKTYGYFVKWT